MKCRLKKGIIAIYEEDIGYANRLMDFLNETEEFSLEAMVFSNKESLQNYLQKHQINILLMGEFMDKSVSERNRSNIKSYSVKGLW